MAKAKERETIDAPRAAEILGLSLMTIHRLCKLGPENGGLENYRLTPGPRSHRRIYVDSIIAYAKKQGRDVTI